MLRNLTRADGILRRETGMLHVTLWLKGRFQAGRLHDSGRFPTRSAPESTSGLPRAENPIRIVFQATNRRLNPATP